MTETIISSATKEVVIGFDRPFVIIGERINPTGRKLLAQEMKDGDFSRVEADAMAQVAAGAHILDVNAGIPLADEPALMARAVKLVQSLTDAPLSIDSSVVAALESGLEAYQGKPLLNSVTGEEERLEQVLPLVKKHGAAVVAICNDDSGISTDIDVRFEVARKIVERAADHGIPANDVVVDPLVMPVGAMADAGVQVFRLIRRLHTELKVNTTCGASNISFGLPNRHGLNPTFLAMAIGAGMTSAITNPLEAALMQAVRGADVLMDHDARCANWISSYREPAPGWSPDPPQQPAQTCPISQQRLSSSAPPESAGGFRLVLRCSGQPVNWVWISIPFAAVVHVAAVARWRPWRAASPRKTLYPAPTTSVKRGRTSSIVSSAGDYGPATA